MCIPVCPPGPSASAAHCRCASPSPPGGKRGLDETWRRSQGMRRAVRRPRCGPRRSAGLGRGRRPGSAVPRLRARRRAMTAARQGCRPACRAGARGRHDAGQVDADSDGPGHGSGLAVLGGGVADGGERPGPGDGREHDDGQRVGDCEQAAARARPRPVPPGAVAGPGSAAPPPGTAAERVSHGGLRPGGESTHRPDRLALRCSDQGGQVNGDADRLGDDHLPGVRARRRICARGRIEPVAEDRRRGAALTMMAPSTTSIRRQISSGSVSYCAALKPSGRSIQSGRAVTVAFHRHALPA